MAPERFVEDNVLLATMQVINEVDRLIQVSADFELAFQMQLDEALRASASAPGRSSSMSRDDTNIANAMGDGEEARVGQVAAGSEDRGVAMEEQKQEMEKLKQEMEDEAEARKEQSRLTEIEAITQHDARFARLLTDIPAEEWANWGENLTDPFTYTCTPDQTCVDLPRKGKALIDFEMPRKGIQFGDHTVASSSIICQSNMWEPAVAVAFLLDADNPDNKSYLATIKEDFHVDKRARVEGRHCGTAEGDCCRICMDAVMLPHTSLLVSDKCMHRFCIECLQKHGETAVKNGRPCITCPEFHCEELWSGNMSERLLSSNSLLMLTKRQIEDALPQSERVYCPFPDCSTLQLRPELPNLPSSSGHPHETAVGGVECFSCSRCFCLECQVPWHSDLTCQEFQNLPKDERSSEDLNLKSLAKAKNWQRCKNCGFMVERRSGCHHITCRCGKGFCYTCGDSWTSSHLCKTRR